MVYFFPASYVRLQKVLFHPPKSANTCGFPHGGLPVPESKSRNISFRPLKQNAENMFQKQLNNASKSTLFLFVPGLNVDQHHHHHHHLLCVLFPWGKPGRHWWSHLLSQIKAPFFNEHIMCRRAQLFQLFPQVLRILGGQKRRHFQGSFAGPMCDDVGDVQVYMFAKKSPTDSSYRFWEAPILL